MNFSWSEQQEELYSSTLEFARSSLLDRSAGPESSTFPRDAWHRMGDVGLLGLSVPEAFGGMGLDSLTTARCVEALGRGSRDTGLVFSAAAHLFAGVMPIAEHGSDALRTELLPDLTSGARIAANAITEAEAGSDVFSLRTTARREGDVFVLDGVKSYVTNGPVADVFVVYATSNPSHGFMGVTAFAVDRDTPGLTVGQPFEKMGLHTSPISSVYLEACRIPAERCIGAVGRGAAVFTGSMLWERACLFAAYLGSMERRLEETIDYAKRRRQFGKALGKHQAVAHRIADMKLRLESSRMMLYRACWNRDQGRQCVMGVALAKLAVSEAAIASALDAIQVHGGMGYATEAGIEVGLRDAIGSTIFSGTSEIQRNLIARELGL